jgi:Holliday junction resolvase-like predicted endonuclease
VFSLFVRLFLKGEVMTKKQSLRSRGQDAAVAYLERIGIRVVERDWVSPAHEKVPIIATDGDTLVRVNVKVRMAADRNSEFVMPRAATCIQHRYQMEEYIKDCGLDGQDIDIRFDEIDLLVIAESRALLRHHRAAYC